MRLLLLLLILPIGLVVWIAISLAVPMPAPIPPAWSDGRNLFAAISTGLLGAAGVAGIAAFAFRGLLHAASCLDGTFGAMGLAPAGHRMFARHFVGLLQHREANASLHPPFAVQPWRLMVSVKAASSVRMALGKSPPLVGTRDLSWFPQDDLEFDACYVYSNDRPAAQRLLDTPTFRRALEPFLAARNLPGTWEIHVEHDRIWLRVRVYRVEEGLVSQWLEGLGNLAEICESER